MKIALLFLFSLIVFLRSIAFCNASTSVITSSSSTLNSVTLHFSTSSESVGWWRINYGTSSSNLNNGYDGSPTTNPSSGTITALSAATTYYMEATFFISGSSERFTSPVVSLATSSASPTPSSSASPTPKATGNVSYPVKVGSNKRYLVDQNNTPYFMVADSAWTLLANLSPSQAASYFADRKSLGFNATLISLLVGPYISGGWDATDVNGNPPFGNTPQAYGSYTLGSPNPSYFSHAVAMVNMAATYGIMVILVPIETGTWLQTLMNAGPTACFNYGVYLGSTFGHCPNVMWMSGNDYNKYSGGDGGFPGGVSGWSVTSTDACVIAVANGIKSANPAWIQTVELGGSTHNLTNFGQSSSTDDSKWWSVLGANWGYTDLPAYQTAKVDWLNSSIPVIPYIMGEFTYEGYDNGADVDFPAYINGRKANWNAACSGASGFEYGNSALFSNGWQNDLDTHGSIQAGYLNSFFSKIAWWKLVPDFAHAFVTSGYGTEFTNLSSLYTTNAGNSSDNGTDSYVHLDNYVPASVSSDGTLGLAYCQASSTITVVMTKFTGSVSAQWYDPTNNSYSKVAGSPFSNTGTRSFSTPGNNSTGDPDWVLLLTLN